MSRKKRSNKNKQNKSLKKELSIIKEKRDGGAIAIRGFNFQFLYACYQILSSKDDNYTI